MSEPAALPHVKVVHSGSIVGNPAMNLCAVGKEVRRLQHILCAHPVATVGQADRQVLLKPVIHDVEPVRGAGRRWRTSSASRRRELRRPRCRGQQLRSLSRSGGAQTGSLTHGAGPACGSGTNTGKEQIMLDEHKDGAVCRNKRLMEQLMRQNQS
jgi:hypothetical protein